MSSSAHPPINVTDEALSVDDIKKLYTKEHANIYALIQENAKAVMYDSPLLKLHTQRHDIINNIQTVFRAVEVIDEGWLVADKHTSDKINQRYPNTVAELNELRQIKSETLSLNHIEAFENLTLDHGYLTLYSLLSLMQENDIAEPSTFASLIDKLINKGHITSDLENLALTSKGEEIIEALDALALPTYDANFSKALQEDLVLIENGEKEPIDVITKYTGFLTGKYEATNTKEWLSHISSKNETTQSVQNVEIDFALLSTIKDKKEIPLDKSEISQRHLDIKAYLDAFTVQLITFSDIEKTYAAMQMLQSALRIMNTHEFYKVLRNDSAMRYALELSLEALDERHIYETAIANIIIEIRKQPSLLKGYEDGIANINALFH